MASSKLYISSKSIIFPTYLYFFLASNNHSAPAAPSRRQVLSLTLMEPPYRHYCNFYTSKFPMPESHTCFNFHCLLPVTPCVRVQVCPFTPLLPVTVFLISFIPTSDPPSFPSQVPTHALSSHCLTRTEPRPCKLRAHQRRTVAFRRINEVEQANEDALTIQIETF